MMSTTHPFEQEEVMAYLDGELSVNRAEGIAVHLRECAECAALAEQLRGVSSELVNWGVEAAPESLTKSLAAAAAERRLANLKSSAGFVRLLTEKIPLLGNRWVWGVAGVLAMGVVMLVVGRPNLLRVPDAQRLASQQLAYEERLRASQRMEENAISSNLEEPRAAGMQPAPPAAAPQAQPTETMIARTASVSLLVKDFGPVEAAVKAIAQRDNGYIANLNTSSPQDAERTLSATLAIPSPQLEAAIAELKQLGHVEQELQSGEEVTKEFTDRAARLKNARATEQRLLDVLREHTGRVADILQAEQEIARVRGEIEQMESDQKALQTRVDFATVQLSVQEEYKASLQGAPPSTGRRLRNAAVDGYSSLIENVIGIGVFALRALPTLLLWGVILFIPARWMWKRFRRRAVPQS